MQTRTIDLPYFGRAKVTFSADSDAAAYDRLNGVQTEQRSYAPTMSAMSFTRLHEGFYEAVSSDTGCTYSVRKRVAKGDWMAVAESDDVIIETGMATKKAAIATCIDYDADFAMDLT